LESVAAGSGALGRSVGRHHQAGGGCVQRSVRCCRSGSVSSAAFRIPAGRRDQARTSGGSEATRYSASSEITGTPPREERFLKGRDSAAFFFACDGTRVIWVALF